MKQVSSKVNTFQRGGRFSGLLPQSVRAASRVCKSQCRAAKDVTHRSYKEGTPKPPSAISDVQSNPVSHIILGLHSLLANRPYWLQNARFLG